MRCSHLRELVRPVIAAPMAGGISTAALVAAAGAAGGMGFLAAGYRSVADVAAEVAAVRARWSGPFGVNLFVPGPPVDLPAARRYADRLAPLAHDLGVVLPEPRDDDDAYQAKLTLLLDDPVPAVSFTFGCPDAATVARLRGVGTWTLATVTSAAEAEAAVAAGVDALVAQGPDAGGHRGTWDPLVNPPALPLDDLLAEIRTAVTAPVVASGGLGTVEAIRSVLSSADAVQVGTVLLDADEAGTSLPYRRALRDPRFAETVLTRAFSGRWARGLRNGFTDRFGDHAPAAYPAVNQLTGPLRRAATLAGDPDLLSLWAGTGWRTLPSGPARRILEALVPKVPA